MIDDTAGLEFEGIEAHPYQRILGKVLLNGEDVNLEQVKVGLAWHYKKYQWEQSTSDRVKYSDAELEARRLNLGLWRDTIRYHHGSIDRPSGNI